MGSQSESLSDTGAEAHALPTRATLRRFLALGDLYAIITHESINVWLHPAVCSVSAPP